MRALILNGSGEADALTGGIGRTLTRMLGDNGWEVTAFILPGMDIAYCHGCFNCWVKTPGICVIDDAGRDLTRAAAQADLMVFLTPVTFGGYGSALKRAVDRLIPNLLPYFTRVHGEVHHKFRYRQPSKMLAVGTMDVADSETADIFRLLHKRNSINYSSPLHDARVFVAGTPEVAIEQELVGVLVELECVTT